MKDEYDPSKWVWGIFYYNKEDKRIFPPKISGLGWTINFANPYSVLAFISVIILINVLVYFLQRGYW